jgi:hypothetical protein
MEYTIALPWPVEEKYCDDVGMISFKFELINTNFICIPKFQVINDG